MLIALGPLRIMLGQRERMSPAMVVERHTEKASCVIEEI
jgi:hypothetical protein